MKKILLTALAAAALCSCANKQKFVIQGNFEGLGSEMVYLLDREGIALDSTKVENGLFEFAGIAQEPGIRYILDTRDRESPSTFRAQLILEPGTISITNDAENKERPSVAGTPANDANAAFTAAGNKLIQEFRNPETTDERRDTIETEYNDLARSTMEANRSNYFGAMLLDQQLGYELSGQELLDQIALFSPELQQSEILTKLKQSAEQKMRTEIGQNYIDITQNTAEGQPLSLKSVIENPANKYTLLDFWASWCGPCMAEIPVLTKTYTEFRSKGFEIYGVSFDKDRAKWLAAVADNKMNWLHVSDLTGFDNPAAKEYAIQGIPSNFLIDAQGKIVASNLRGEGLYEKVASLLAE